jgi:hypothetical protein
MIDQVIRHLEAFLESTNNQLRSSPCVCARTRDLRAMPNIATQIFPGISKTAMRKPANEAGLLYCHS